MKKVLSVALIALFVLAVFPLTVAAASESDLTFELNTTDNTYTVTGCSNSASGKLVIPATYNGKLVTGIGNYAFDNCSKLTDVTFPKSIKSFGVAVFAHCDGLASIRVDSENKLFDSRNNCNAVIETATNTLVVGCKSTTIPKDVKRIGDWAFVQFNNLLTSISIPNGVTHIGAWAFAQCSGLTSITIPNSVTQIDRNAFYGCSGLKIVSIGSGLTSISDYMFAECWDLTSVMIPDGVKSIGGYAFDNDAALKSVTIPNSVASIGGFAFNDCKNLTIGCNPGSYAEKWAKENSVAYQLLCPAPATVKVSKVAKGLQITWSAAKTATKFRVYRRELDSSGKVIAGWQTLLTTTDLKTRTYLDTKAVNGHRYQYTVRACRDDAGGATWSPIGTCTSYYCLATPAITIANVTGGVSIKWKAVKGAAGYIVYRKAGSATSWTKLATLKGNAKVSYADTKVSNGVTYTYTVKAYNSGNYSAITTKKIIFLTAPTKATVSSGKAGITVKWGRNSKADGYYIYRKAGSGSWTKLTTVKGNTKVTYIDASAKKGTTYAYRAIAYKSTSRSSYYTSTSIKDKY